MSTTSALHHLLCAILLAAAISGGCGGEKFTYARIETPYGNIKVKLYNSTPKHRDNFIKLAQEGFYDSLLFHRVMAGFMIQGGDPLSKQATPGTQLGQGGPGYEIEPEIGELHFRGALAAARTQNPQKRSSGSQFYIVQGQPLNEEILDNIESQKHFKYSPEAREQYKELGGAPFLDQDYTVFGEVVDGMEVVDKIAQAERDINDRPATDIPMKIVITNR